MLLTREEWDKIPEGKQLKLKCKCPEHGPRRNDCKTCNFLLAYKGSARSLAVKTGKTEELCQELIANHEHQFPEIWAFLKMLGERGKQLLEARTFAGRRRSFRRPDWQEAKKRANEKAQKKWKRDAISREISKELAVMYASIDRALNNVPTLFIYPALKEAPLIEFH